MSADCGGDHARLQKVKRLPVTGEGGRLTGMLSRLDIFRAVMRESPDWASFGEQSVQVGALRRVADIMRRETQSVLPQTPLAEVIRFIDADDIQRVAVLDPQGCFLGLISDSDLLASVSQDNPEGFLDLMARLPASPGAPRIAREKSDRSFGSLRFREYAWRDTLDTLGRQAQLHRVGTP